MTETHVWTQYDPRGTRSRVRGHIIQGPVEFELCAEGGLYVIRRTEHGGRRDVVTETARGRYPDTMEAWRELARELRSP